MNGECEKSKMAIHVYIPIFARHNSLQVKYNCSVIEKHLGFREHCEILCGMCLKTVKRF
jgi:hypothetical protein